MKKPTERPAASERQEIEDFCVARGMTRTQFRQIWKTTHTRREGRQALVDHMKQNSNASR